MNFGKKQKSGAPLTPVYLVPFHPLGKPKVWPKQGWRVFRITVTGCLTACLEDPPTVVGSWPCALWIILFPSKEKNKSVMGRTVIRPLPFSTWENWGPQSYLACPGRQSARVLSLGLGLTSLRSWCGEQPVLIFSIPAVTQDGPQAGPRGSLGEPPYAPKC